MALEADYWDYAATLSTAAGNPGKPHPPSSCPHPAVYTITRAGELCAYAGRDAAYHAVQRTAPRYLQPLVLLIRAALPACVQLMPQFGAGWEGAANPALTRLFGKVRQVIITDSLREQFCSLPFPLVLRWARLDQLAVDSENSGGGAAHSLVQAAVQQRHPTH